MNGWPRILIDPVERTLDPEPSGRRFFVAVAKAALTGLGGALILLVAIWAMLS